MTLRLFVLLLGGLTVMGCAPTAPTPRPQAVPEKPSLRQRAAELPGAEIPDGEPLRIRYPGNALFAEGAALPLPGGTAVLDPLAALLVDHPGLRWNTVVRARTGISAEYDLALAKQRAALLQRYFENRGIYGGQMVLTASGADDGPPLELTLMAEPQPTSPASSSGEK